MPFIDKNLLTTKGTPYTWSATESDSIYLDAVIHNDPPTQLGVASVFINTTDTGGSTPTITPTVEFLIDVVNEVYGTANAFDTGDATFTSGGKFENRLDTQNFWKLHKGWRIKLTRSATSALRIDAAWGFEQ